MYKRSAELTELEDIRDQLTSCCYEELYYDLLRSLGSTLHTMSEDSLAKEMKRLAVPHHSNLVNIVALRFITQEREERVRSFVARIRGLASVCELSIKCTKDGCDKKVSYAEQEILNTLVKGIYETETREEVLSKDPHMDLAATILFIEAREAGKRSAGVLSGSTPASGQANKTALVTEDRVQDTARGESCRYCGRNGHGRSPNGNIRKKSCPAWDKECSKCSKKGHFKKCCQSKQGESKITAEGHKIGLYKMEAGLADVQNKFRRDIKHAKVVRSEIIARDTRTGTAPRQLQEI